MGGLAGMSTPSAGGGAGATAGVGGMAGMAGMAGMGGQQDPMTVPLPPLRDDLRLLPGPRGRDGAPTWTIHDPVRNRFHRLTWMGFEMLARWHLGTGAAIRDALHAETTLEPDDEHLIQMVRFLRANALIDMASPNDRDMWERQAQSMRRHWSTWLLHNYLFIRIPLVRPDPFLRGMWPLVRPLFTQTALVLFAMLTVAGVYMVARRWDGFVHTFTQFANLEGLAWMAVALVVSKILHELGHAFTAHRYGCRVPTMGVAFMVLWPVLYTDTSEGWKLTDNRQRLAIGAAGMTAELGVAVLATLVWAFTLDGPVNSAAFFLATAGWTASLIINLNPFMRFDGYYLLGDWLDEPNLQPRAFAVGRWALREILFGFGDPPPEPLTRGRRRFFIIYAWSTWLYRLMLFLGIALLVYAFFIKVVGILLFVVEIIWFILKPMANEMKEWWKRRGDIRLNAHVLGTLAVIGLGLAAVFIPWRGTVVLPAVLEAERSHEVHAPEAARVTRVLVTARDTVTAGQPVAELASPDLAYNRQLTNLRLDVTRLSLDRAYADEEARADVPLLAADLQKLSAEADGLAAREARMTLRSAVDGRVTDVMPGLRPGLWVEPRAVLLRVVDAQRGRVTAYARQEDLARLSPGAPARFHPDDALAPSLAGTVTAVDDVNRPVLDHPMLASDQGGPVAARRDEDGRMLPEHSLYRVVVALDDPDAPPQLRRGTLRVDGKPESLAARMWRTVVGTLIRESAF